MAILRSGSFLLFLLSAALLAASQVALASSDVPFMVAHKKVSLMRLKSGVEQVTVSIDLYNEGSLTAYDVSLNDDSWSQDTFGLASGTTSKTWERLDAGSSASHTFILESKSKGVFHGSPAVIKFRVPTKAALQEAYSTPILPIDVLADKLPEKRFAWVSNTRHTYFIVSNYLFSLTISVVCLQLNVLAFYANRHPWSNLLQAKRLLAQYGSLVSVLTLVGLFIYVISTPSKSSKKKR